MKKFLKENKGIVIKGIISVVLIIFTAVLMSLKSNGDFCETYSRGFGRWLNTILAFIAKYFPISLTEVFAVSSVIIAIILFILIIKDLKGKRFLSAVNRFTTILVAFTTFFTAFYSTMELQYNRKAVPIPLYNEAFDKNEFYAIVEHFADDYIACADKLEFKENGDVISPYTFSELNHLLEKEYKRLNDNEFNGYFSRFTTYCKPMISSGIYSEFQITGLTFGALGEANVNTDAPMSGIPMTMAHELAHVKGVLREDDANLVSIYLLLTSKDYFLRFSAYFWSFYRLLDLARYTGNDSDYNTLSDKIPYKIKLNDYYNYKYWQKHNLMEKIGDFINNLYLQSSGTEGTGSYVDTNTEVDEHEQVIYLSVWQKLYLGIYYR